MTKEAIMKSEKKIMEELRIKLQQSNIPVKVIQNEHDIIIYTIIIINNHEEGYEYEWAA